MKRGEVFINQMKLLSSLLALQISGAPIILDCNETNVPNKITLLHTNDIHSHLQEFNGFGTSCSPKNIQENKCYGGVARIQYVVEQYRQNSSDVVLFDAGDQFQGTLFFNAFGGDKAAEVMNIMKYDVMTIGNHEFDNGFRINRY